MEEFDILKAVSEAVIEAGGLPTAVDDIEDVNVHAGNDCDDECPFSGLFSYKNFDNWLKFWENLEPFTDEQKKKFVIGFASPTDNPLVNFFSQIYACQPGDVSFATSDKEVMLTRMSTEGDEIGAMLANKIKEITGDEHAVIKSIGTTRGKHRMHKWMIVLMRGLRQNFEPGAAITVGDVRAYLPAEE